MEDNTSLKEWLVGLAQGCDIAADLVIVELMTTAKNTVLNLVINVPSLAPFQEDLEANAFLTLTKFVHAKKGGEEHKPGPFKQQLVAAIKNKSYDWSSKISGTITLPETSARRKKISMTRTEINETHMVTDGDETLYLMHHQETIDSLPEDEKLIIRFLIDGFSKNKIKDRTGIPIRQINAILGRLAMKFERND